MGWELLQFLARAVLTASICTVTYGYLGDFFFLKGVTQCKTNVV